jgi:hypothetical protein
MRESGPWAYAGVNLAHIVGVALLLGAITILDLRLLGLWRRAPLALVSDVAVPVATGDCIVALVTGAALIATKATDYVGNPFMYVKLPVVGIGIVNALALSLSPAWRARSARELTPGERRQLAWMGATSLVCWLTAVVTGRMIGYW